MVFGIFIGLIMSNFEACKLGGNKFETSRRRYQEVAEILSNLCIAISYLQCAPSVLVYGLIHMLFLELCNAERK